MGTERHPVAVFPVAGCRAFPVAGRFRWRRQRCLRLRHRASETNYSLPRRKRHGVPTIDILIWRVLAWQCACTYNVFGHSRNVMACQSYSHMMPSLSPPSALMMSDAFILPCIFCKTPLSMAGAHLSDAVCLLCVCYHVFYVQVGLRLTKWAYSGFRL